MIRIYCDESHDDTTYALGGLVASPHGWECFTPAWKDMLVEVGAPAFHAAEIENRETVSGSRFKHWDRAAVVKGFTRAVDVIVDRKNCAVLWALGVSVSIPGFRPPIEDKAAIWFLLFTRLLQAVTDTLVPQMGIDFLFDDKPEVRDIVNAHYYRARDIVNDFLPGKFETLSFASDEVVLPLQAADLFVYEWRKRSTDKVKNPTKAVRRSYARIRERLDADDKAVLHHYNADALKAIQETGDRGGNMIEAMWSYPTTKD